MRVLLRFRRHWLGAAVALWALGLISAPLGAQTAAFLHVVTAVNRVSPEWTVIDHPLLNNRPGAVFFVGHLRNPPGATPTLHPHPIDVWYSGSRWLIENANGGEHALGTGFAVWVPEVSTAFPAYFVHETTSANVVLNLTVLDHPFLNGNPSAHLSVTLNAPTAGFPHYLGVWYDPGSARWTVFTQDQATMPAGLRFFVCFQGCSMFPGVTAYLWHVTTSANTVGPDTFLGLGQSYWNLLVTPEYTGTFLNEPIGIRWLPAVGQQAIFQETLADMPLGIRFHRLVTRGIFSSGFESGTLLGWWIGP